MSRRKLGLAALGVVVVSGLAYFVLRGGHSSPTNGITAENASPGAGLSVNTVHPCQKTLERTVEQVGSIMPWAQAELYAKTSGYLKSIQREPAPLFVGDLVMQPLSVGELPLVKAARLAISIQRGLSQSPEKNIGSRVSAGEVLLEIDSPERAQEIVEKETLVRQRLAELEAARTALATFDASINAAKAQIAQAKADVRKFESEHIFRNKEWLRLKVLVQSRTVPQEIADEKQNQVNAAQAAWESSLAKVQTAQAELAVISSKFATAHADLKVKEALVQAARDSLHLADVLADYSRIVAPFDGIITFRGVDEGDFIQNATSGQARRLMTVTSMDKVKVVLQVPDRDAAWIKAGAEASVVVDQRTGKIAKGCVVRMAHALDPQTRTMQVEIDLDNRDRHLLPGMYGKVILTLEKIPNAQAVPATAVFSRKGENFILEVRDGIARKQRVRIRFDDGKEMEVVKLVGNTEVPLNGAEELIVSNKGEIADGQRVRATLLHSSAARPGPGNAAKDAKDGTKLKAVGTIAPRRADGSAG